MLEKLPCARHGLNISFLKTHAKTTQIIPIHKSNDPTIISNHRPIAILPVTSKLLEKIHCKQLSLYLENGNWLNDSQRGFRAKQSIMSALLLFTEHLRYSLNKGQITGAIFIDLRKPFDNLNHQILLDELISF